jgi:hypothetical protein
MLQKLSPWALASIALSACAGGESRSTPGGVSMTEASAADPAMRGTSYEPARTFAQTYCTPCHWSEGRHAKQPIAYAVFQVDTYDSWASGHAMVLTALDKWNPGSIVMPPADAPASPPDDQRGLVLDWVRRGSPNTPDGR